MDLDGWTGIWTVSSFLLGQAVVVGAAMLNNRSQAKREVEARQAQRTKALEDRRDQFELTHLQDLHQALSELLLVGGHNIEEWCRYHRLTAAQPTRRRTQEQMDETRESCLENANRLETAADTQSQLISTLAGLVLDAHLRQQVVRARSRYEGLGIQLADEGVDAAEAELPNVLTRLAEARDDVATRIREIYAAW